MKCWVAISESIYQDMIFENEGMISEGLQRVVEMKVDEIWAVD